MRGRGISPRTRSDAAMIDPKLLRSSAADVARNLARRGFTLDVTAFTALEERRHGV